MAPKKKGNKKSKDDWEADFGEQPDPIAAAAQEGESAEAAHDDEQNEGGRGGGLLAALKNNKNKKKKKGKAVEEDFLVGEGSTAADGSDDHPEPDVIQDLAKKASEEANTDDLFAAQVSKMKGGKVTQGKKDDPPTENGEGSDGEEGGGLKSKREKEKEKREREKQRKKEQVHSGIGFKHSMFSLLAFD